MEGHKGRTVLESGTLLAALFRRDRGPREETESSNRFRGATTMISRSSVKITRRKNLARS